MSMSTSIYPLRWVWGWWWFFPWGSL